MEAVVMENPEKMGLQVPRDLSDMGDLLDKQAIQDPLGVARQSVILVEQVLQGL
jgi:hypothetical protein